MEWILGWLQTQVPIGQIWLFVLLSLLSIFSLNFITILILPKHFTDPPPPPYDPSDPSFGSYLYLNMPRLGMPILTWEFPGQLFSIALMEEIIFRFVLLGGAIQIWGATWPVLLVLALSSIIFGLMHGRPVNILLQGVGGIVFCIIFLKCGGFAHHFLMATFVVALAHSIFNSIVALFNLISGHPYL